MGARRHSERVVLAATILWLEGDTIPMIVAQLNRWLDRHERRRLNAPAVKGILRRGEYWHRGSRAKRQGQLNYLRSDGNDEGGIFGDRKWSARHLEPNQLDR